MLLVVSVNPALKPGKLVPIPASPRPPLAVWPMTPPIDRPRFNLFVKACERRTAAGARLNFPIAAEQFEANRIGFQQNLALATREFQESLDRRQLSFCQLKLLFVEGGFLGGLRPRG